MKKLFYSFLIVLCSLVAGCAGNISPNTYDSSEIGVASKVVHGRIIAKRAVNIDNHTGAGGLAGATAGAAAGTMAGHNAATGVIGAVGGAVVGGVVGHGVDKAVNRHRGYEYIIKLRNGSTVSIVQAEDLNVHVNQRVLIIYGAKTRIIPDTIPHA